MREATPRAPPAPESLPPFPLALGLIALAAWRLELRQGCGHVAYYPVRLLAAERGWQTARQRRAAAPGVCSLQFEPMTVNLIAAPA
jgi:hypothetical protein